MNEIWIVKDHTGKELPLASEVLLCSRQELLPRALKRMVKYWGIALGCVVVPVLHFILVPGFFLFGIYIGMQTLKLNYKIIEGKFSCPQCSKENSLKDLWFKEVQSPICQECGVQVTLQKKLT